MLAAIDVAVSLARADGEPTAERVETLGAGWVAEEALAIALYCALVARDYEHGVRLAVNHSGDSDSTGSMAGNVLGVMRGLGQVPPRWLAQLELRDVITTIASDVAGARSGEDEPSWDRYPGW